MAYNPESVTLTKSLVLRGVLIIYIIAFTSLYVQVQGLFGDNGVAPLRDFLAKSSKTQKGPLEVYNILTLAPKLRLSHGTLVELLCLTSVLVAFGALFVRRFCNALSMGFLWYTYYSINQVGQGFMSFHSDLMLLEVGFIAILLAPLLPSGKSSNTDHDHIAMFLLKWLTFRYFVSNVLNVYMDNDKAWYNMTAIPMLAQGVQFPSVFSWRAFQFASDWAKIFQAYEHSIKLLAPFLCFFDLKLSRQMAFYSLLHIALANALFFNFGWTDLLISVLLITYHRDSYFHQDKRARQSTFKTIIDLLVVSGYVGAVGFTLVKYYGLKYTNGVLAAKVQFTPDQFKLLADHLVPVSLVLGTLGLLASLRTTYFTSKRKTSVIKTLLYTLIMVPIFFSTFPTLMRFAPGLENKVKPLAYTKDVSRLTAPFMLSNNYLILSKVSQHYSDGRPELQLQGRASAEESTWQQFDLRYKPGQPAKELSRVLPHIPRIDLKMWYAARSSLQNNQWLQTLAYRVATKEPDVINLLAPAGPLPKVAQVRIAQYNYKYSSSTRQPFAGYWSQSKYVSEYMPATSVDALKLAVKATGISLTPATKTAGDVSKYLQISSDYIRGVDHTAVIWTSLALAATSLFRGA